MKNTSPVLRGSCALLMLLLLTVRAEAFWMLRTVSPLSGTNGRGPFCGLAQGSNGMFYGMTTGNGANNKGTIYVLDTNEVVAPLFNFNGTNGYFAVSSLLTESDGIMYGSTVWGGSTYGSPSTLGYGFGTFFCVTPDGSFTNLLSFTGTNGAYPASPLIHGADGNLYGTTEDTDDDWGVTNTGGFGTVFKISTNGDFATVFSFNGTNGRCPSGRLLQGLDGSLYGTTVTGGISNQGTVFMLTTNGVLTTLVSFVGTNGARPRAGLVLGDDGCLFGTTFEGGTNLNSNFNGRPGFGTVFRLNMNGDLQTLHYFKGNSSFNSPDGSHPTQMTRGADGFIYGTTILGGVVLHGQGGWGTVFRIGTNGAFESLSAFNLMNGAQPIGDILALADGSFYGTSENGGVSTLFHLGPGVGPVIQDVTLQPEEGSSFLTFRFPALGGVFYGVETNATLNPAGWNSASEYYFVSNTNVLAAGYLLPIPHIHINQVDQMFFRLVLLPP